MNNSVKAAGTLRKTWTAPHLEKVGTMADVAGFGTGTDQGRFSPTLS